LYAYQLRRWFACCEMNQLDPLVGVQRPHVELNLRHLGETGLMPSSVNTMTHGVRRDHLPARAGDAPDRRFVSRRGQA
jgi:integrase/recombinase XerD